MHMPKYRKFLLAAAILYFAVASTHLFAVGPVMLGVKGGLNSANLRIKSNFTTSSYQTRSEFTWGGFLSYRITPFFSVQVEVLDSPKGSTLPSGITTSNESVTLEYQYTEVPLLIKWAQGIGSKLTPSLYAGPYYAHLRRAEAVSKGRLTPFNEPLTDQRSYDWGLVFGFSLGYDLGPFTLIGDVRYDLGLTDVDLTAGSTINHRGFSFTAGIGF